MDILIQKKIQKNGWLSQYGIRMGVKEGYNVTQGQNVTIWEEGHCESIKNVTEWIF
jgi:hypothetical protein